MHVLVIFQHCTSTPVKRGRGRPRRHSGKYSKEKADPGSDHSKLATLDEKWLDTVSWLDKDTHPLKSINKDETPAKVQSPRTLHISPGTKGPKPKERHHSEANKVRHNSGANKVRHHSGANKVRHNSEANKVRHHSGANKVRHNSGAKHLPEKQGAEINVENMKKKSSDPASAKESKLKEQSIDKGKDAVLPLSTSGRVLHVNESDIARKKGMKQVRENQQKILQILQQKKASTPDKVTASPHRSSTTTANHLGPSNTQTSKTSGPYKNTKLDCGDIETNSLKLGRSMQSYPTKGTFGEMLHRIIDANIRGSSLFGTSGDFEPEMRNILSGSALETYDKNAAVSACSEGETETIETSDKTELKDASPSQEDKSAEYVFSYRLVSRALAFILLNANFVKKVATGDIGLPFVRLPTHL